MTAEDLALEADRLVKMAARGHERPRNGAAGRAMAMLAFAAGLLVAALGAPAADEPVRSQSTAERDGTDSARVQPAAKQFATPNQPDVSASDARAVDALYRLLIRPQPATPSDTRSSTPPSGSARQ